MAIRKPTPAAAKSAAMAEIMAEAGESKYRNGSLIEGTVSAIKGDDVFVDIGYKSTGMIGIDEFGEGAEVKVGDKVTVMLRELENDKTGMVVLSKRAADDKIRWDKILERYVEGCVVTGTIKSAVRGGLLVQIDDVEAFLPGSQVEVAPVKELEPYVGQTFDFKVIKISNERRNLIVSRRELIEGQLAEKKAELLACLQKGEVRKGRVKNITDFGAFVDLDGIDGLLHITDMSWGRVKHPSEILKVGQEIDVMVLDVDRDRERISLGLKQTTENPWNSIQDRFPVGARVSGKVVNLAAYGAFVEIAPGIEGLVHISEFSWTKRVARASDVLSVGDEVQVVVLSVDMENQKIALGIRQTQANPWDTVQERFPVGSKVKGKVRNFTAYGAFIELEEGIDGMIHVSDMSWTRKINHPSECLQKGQEVEAVVLDVNPKDQRISLGLKQAQPDPWDKIAQKFPVGSVVKGKVSKIASFGAFIELEDGVDGLVHISQISDQRVDKVKDALDVGQEVEARVVKVDRGERRIGLSIRAMSMSDAEVQALASESSGEDSDSRSTSTSGSENLGGLSAAFDNAFANVEWQPGEAN
ncbi:MAG: 30S ribosomal protein S1 [Kiritimatiellae bacterium]|nr:30S ribosomal protein S1 [Kiritimatiellia bacterium]MBQ3344574.1 30S ribosomal protein S1 [Kiritimatiellia bacterium]